MSPTPIFFRSGLSNKSDFAAAVAAGVAAGISVMDVSRPVLLDAWLFLSRGGALFADTGAFGAFRRGKPLTDREFERALAAYDYLVNAGGDLHVVAPDVVGDQLATLAVVGRYAPRLSALAARGAHILIPLQKGDIPLAEFHRQVAALLPGVRFRPALPSNAAALTEDEALQFLAAVRPHAVHFLGAARSQRFQATLASARELLPQCEFTYDAAVIRSLIGKLHPTSDEAVSERAADMLIEEIDQGELAMALQEGDPAVLHSVAEFLCAGRRDGGTPDSILAEIEVARMASGGDIQEAIEQVAPGILDSYWPYFATKWAKSEALRTWRTHALASHPSFHTDPAPQLAQPSLFPA